MFDCLLKECYCLLLLEPLCSLNSPRVSTQYLIFVRCGGFGESIACVQNLGRPTSLFLGDAARKSVDAVSPTQNPGVSHDDTSRISPNIKPFVKEKYHQLFTSIRVLRKPRKRCRNECVAIHIPTLARFLCDNRIAFCWFGG